MKIEHKIKRLHELYNIMKPSHIRKLHNIAFDVEKDSVGFGNDILDGKDFITLLKWYTRLYPIFEK